MESNMNDIPGWGQDTDAPPGKDVYLALLKTAESHSLDELWVNTRLQENGAICGRDGDEIILISFTWKARATVLDAIGEHAKKQKPPSTRGKKKDKEAAQEPPKSTNVEPAISEQKASSSTDTTSTTVGSNHGWSRVNVETGEVEYVAPSECASAEDRQAAESFIKETWPDKVGEPEYTLVNAEHISDAEPGTVEYWIDWLNALSEDATNADFSSAWDSWLNSVNIDQLGDAYKRIEQLRTEREQDPGYPVVYSLLEGELVAREIVAASQQLEKKQLPAVPDQALIDRLFEFYGLQGVETIEDADQRIRRAGENIRMLQTKLTDCTAILEKAFKDYHAITKFYQRNFQMFGDQNLRRKGDGSYAAKNCDLSPFVKLFFRTTGGVKVDDRDMITEWLERQPPEVHKAVRAERKLSYRAPDVIKWAIANNVRIPGTREDTKDPLGQVTIGGDKAFSIRSLRERLKVTAQAAVAIGEDQDDEDS